MIFFIASHNYNQVVSEASEKSNKSIFNGLVESKVQLNEYIKKQMDQFQSIDTLLIDLTCIADSNEEIIQALDGFRLLYGNVKIIILAPGRQTGDPLLSEIFNLGIYNIVTEEQEDKIVTDLTDCILSGKQYKDSVKYKIVPDTETIPKGKKIIPPVKEKIIIQNEIKQMVNKAQIGFVGTQSRIGVTHNAIVSGYFLKSKGNKVAIVENTDVPEKCFNAIKTSFDGIEIKEDYFTLNQVDFYPDYDLEKIHLVLARNYNFVLVDFGLFSPDFIAEMNRCVLQIVVAGSKPWELGHINWLFDNIPEDTLKDFSYLFNFTSFDLEDNIRENMFPLEKVYFADSIPDPFNASWKGHHYLDAIFAEYVSSPPSTEGNKKKKPFLGIFKL